MWMNFQLLAIAYIGILAACLSNPVRSPANSESFARVEPGTFWMGCENGDNDEKPVHSVTISNAFHISKFEVNQKQWQELMGDNRSYIKGDELPMESVSWEGAVEYCNRLSRKEGLTPCYSGRGAGTRCNFSANGYRLPTEAEWEFAARGGNQSKGFAYAGSDSAAEAGWSEENSGERTHPAGQKIPNELGLYDMSGNVYEWCWDWYDAYGSSAQTDPQGPISGSPVSFRVNRGGSYRHGDRNLRVANRSYDSAQFGTYISIGFRLVRSDQPIRYQVPPAKVADVLVANEGE